MISRRRTLRSGYVEAPAVKVQGAHRRENADVDERPRRRPQSAVDSELRQDAGRGWRIRSAMKSVCDRSKFVNPRGSNRRTSSSRTVSPSVAPRNSRRLLRLRDLGGGGAPCEPARPPPAPVTATDTVQVHAFASASSPSVMRAAATTFSCRVRWRRSGAPMILAVPHLSPTACGPLVLLLLRRLCLPAAKRLAMFTLSPCSQRGADSRRKSAAARAKASP